MPEFDSTAAALLITALIYIYHKNQWKLINYIDILLFLSLQANCKE